jgi:hypothetical protein
LDFKRIKEPIQLFYLCAIVLGVRIMNKLLVSLLMLFAIGGCTTDTSRLKEDNTIKTLTVKWQRLVDEKGQTCDRCGSTEREIEKAMSSLKQSLAPLGIKVALKKKALDPATFAKDVYQSNRIWVGGRTLEEWLGARVGKSPCGFCCAELGVDVECRTIEIEGQVYETIPADLITKAGLLAASQLLTGEPDEPCCATTTSIGISSSGCCP